MTLKADTTNIDSRNPQQPPPPPPPPPIPSQLQTQLHHHPYTTQSSYPRNKISSSSSSSSSSSKPINLRTKPSPFIQKLQHAPAGYWFESGDAAVEIDLVSPIGWYFLYGTLMDPSFLAEVLALPSHRRPKMRPAKMVGYAVKLWGQYPALLDGEAGQEVYGMAWRVREKKDAVRLAEYETRAYRPAPCLIELTTDEGGDDDDDDYNNSGKSGFVGGKGTVLQGHAFKFRDGNESELREGSFDLKNWLRLVGR